MLALLITELRVKRSKKVKRNPYKNAPTRSVLVSFFCIKYFSVITLHDSNFNYTVSNKKFNVFSNNRRISRINLRTFNILHHWRPKICRIRHPIPLLSLSHAGQTSRTTLPCHESVYSVRFAFK